MFDFPKMFDFSVNKNDILCRTEGVYGLGLYHHGMVGSYLLNSVQILIYFLLFYIICRTTRPKMTFTLFVQIFALSVLG
jgi:hypothetical protein